MTASWESERQARCPNFDWPIPKLGDVGLYLVAIAQLGDEFCRPYNKGRQDRKEMVRMS